ncbi:MAG: MFS transporter [Clostridiales bacterium]|nr:MFS transporter [Clostridiales bacterium]
MKEKVLKLREKIGYASGEFGQTLFWVAISFWLMIFLTDELGLPAALAGTAALIAKLWDAITDPIVGQLSEKTKSKWGRRRPWLLFGAIPFGITYFIMFLNPGFSNVTVLFFWVLFAYMLLNTAYTCVNIPYNSLLYELTPDYNQRTSISGYKSVFAVIATLVAAGAAQPIMNMFETTTAGFMGMGAVFGLLIAVFVLLPFFFVKERYVKPTGKKEGSIFKKNAEALKNKPFRLLLITWMVNTIGMSMIMANLVYYFKYIFGDENLVTTAMMVLIGASLIFIPIVVKLSKKIDKNWVYAVGIILYLVAIIAIFFLGHELGIVFVYAMMLIAGIGLSAHNVTPWAMVPDTIDYGYVKTGVRTSGTYYGLWAFVIKVGAAFAVFFLGIVLDLFGYVANATQTATSLLGIKLALGPIPGVFFAIAIICLIRYPLSKKMHTEIRKQIEEMELEEASEIE